MKKLVFRCRWKVGDRLAQSDISGQPVPDGWSHNRGSTPSNLSSGPKSRLQCHSGVKNDNGRRLPCVCRTRRRHYHAMKHRCTDYATTHASTVCLHLDRTSHHSPVTSPAATLSINYTYFGDRSLSAAGPRVWISLSLHLRQDMNYARFQHKLKTFLFGN